jgi:hypothetical protein
MLAETVGRSDKFRKNDKAPMTGLAMEFCGRGERIRTSGLYVPNVALYRAKLHPDWYGSY